MRRARASTGSAVTFHPPRTGSDGKDAKLDYASDSAAQTIASPRGESGGDIAFRTSKHRGKGGK